MEAVPCKCMGKCAMANVNVRVLKEDTNPQHHSHVGVDDKSLILSHGKEFISECCINHETWWLFL